MTKEEKQNEKRIKKEEKLYKNSLGGIQWIWLLYQMAL